MIAPVIYIEANTQGAGKSTLANMAIAIGATQGRRPFGMSCKPGPRGSWVPDEKEVDAALMGGRPMFFDNAIGTLDNPKLATIATSGGCAVRPFHTQQQIDARAVWPVFVTTNGGQLGADWTRRVLPVRLEQRTEQRPEWRQPDPCDDLIPEHWRELHAAALTILAAYLAEGQHDEQRTRCKWYGFEQWSRLVGDALAWLGADISTLLEQARDYETDRAEVPLIEAIKAYLKASEADGFTVSQLAQPTGPVRADAAEGARVQLCAAIRTAANVAADETLRPHTIGRVLRDHGRAVGNERIANRPRRGRGNVGLWGVKEETPDGPVWWSGKLAAKLAADAEGQAA